MKKAFALMSAFAVSASLLTMTGCGDKKEENSESSNDVVYYTTAVISGEVVKNEPVTEETASPAPEKIIEGFIGDTLENGGLSVILEKVMIIAEETSEDTKLYCAVFDIKNTTAESIEVNYLSNFTVNADEKDIGMEGITSVMAMSMAKKKVTDTEKFYTNIASGSSAKGYITFETPKSAEEITINYYPYNYKDNNDFGFAYKATVSELPVI